MCGVEDGSIWVRIWREASERSAWSDIRCGVRIGEHEYSADDRHGCDEGTPDDTSSSALGGHCKIDG